MKSEYVEAYSELLKHGFLRMERLHSLKIHAIDYCEHYLKQNPHESRKQVLQDPKQILSHANVFEGLKF